MEEEALRQEIRKKKAKEGKAKAPELSAKQKEAMRLQLEKETEVQAKVAALLASCSPVLELLEAVGVVSPEVLAPRLPQLLPVLHEAVKSPVVASRTCPLLSSLCLAVFTGQKAGLGMLMAGVTHQARLDQSWATALIRLHSASVTATEQGEEDVLSQPPPPSRGRRRTSPVISQPLPSSTASPSCAPPSSATPARRMSSLSPRPSSTAFPS